MRRSSILILAISAMALGSLPSRSLASNLVVPVRTRAVVGAPAARGGPLGLFRLHHKKAAAPRVTFPQMYLVENLRRPCQTSPTQPGVPGYGSRHGRLCARLSAVGRILHHKTPHCIPWCYIGRPCGCCEHEWETLRPGTPRHMFYAAMIRSGLLPAHPVQ